MCAHYDYTSMYVYGCIVPDMCYNTMCPFSVQFVKKGKAKGGDVNDIWTLASMKVPGC